MHPKAEVSAHLQFVAAALRGFTLDDHLLDERHHYDHQRPHARRSDAIGWLLQRLRRQPEQFHGLQARYGNLHRSNGIQEM